MSIVANQSLSKKCHQERGRLDCNDCVVAKVHKAITWNQMASSATELVECVAKCDEPWYSIVIGILLTIPLTTNSCLIGITGTISSRYFINN